MTDDSDPLRLETATAKAIPGWSGDGDGEHFSGETWLSPHENHAAAN
jgi:hypothetical protein